MVIRSPTFEVNFVVATLRDGSGSTQTSISTIRSVSKTKASNCKSGKDVNMTVQDQQALESINWENDELIEQLGNVNAGKSLFEDLMSEVNSKRKSVKNCKVQISDSDSVVSKRVKDNNLDVIPNSPEPCVSGAQKIFSRCYEPTFHKSMIDFGDVLVPNSDPESDVEMN